MVFDPMNDSPNIPDSYWAATAEPLSGVHDLARNLECETVVVGAGITGLSTALHIAENGRDVTVLDAHEPGWGASGRNNGQVVAALKHEPDEFAREFGAARGEELIRTVGEGPDLVFSLVERYGMDCAARRCGIITAAHSRPSLDALVRRTEVWVRRGVPLRVLTRAEIAERSGTEYYLGGSLDPRGGGINPLGYVRGLARAVASNGGRVFQKARVRSVERDGQSWSIRTEAGCTLKARRVVFATNAHTGDVWPGLRQTFLPARTPQLVSRPLDEALRGNILRDGQIMSDTRRLTVGVRLHPDGRLHMGGGSGTSGAEREAPYRTLAAHARTLFPYLGDIQWQYRWSGFMAMTPDRYPRLFAPAPGIAAVLGYSGRGLAMATLMGRELARWVAGDAKIDRLALPVSPIRRLPYHFARGVIGSCAIAFYGLADRLDSR